MALTIVVPKKDKKKNNTLFVILCVLIVILLLANIGAAIYIVTGGTKYGSPSFKADNRYVIGYVMNDDKATTDAITFADNELSPGAQVNKMLRIENYGLKAKYIRLYCEFQISFDGENYESKDFLNFDLRRSSSLIKNSSDNKFYYLNSLERNTYLDLFASFQIKTELSGDDLYEQQYAKTNYYKIIIRIDTIDSSGETINPDAVDEIWK